jgi:hypothetical protein
MKLIKFNMLSNTTHPSRLRFPHETHLLRFPAANSVMRSLQSMMDAFFKQFLTRLESCTLYTALIFQACSARHITPVKNFTNSLSPPRFLSFHAQDTEFWLNVHCRCYFCCCDLGSGKSCFRRKTISAFICVRAT